jgi:hypothetical protein
MSLLLNIAAIGFSTGVLIVYAARIAKNIYSRYQAKRAKKLKSNPYQIQESYQKSIILKGEKHYYCKLLPVVGVYFHNN